MSSANKTIYISVAAIFAVLFINFLFNFDQTDEYNCSDLIDKQSYLVFGSDVQYIACYGVVTVDKDISNPKSRYAYTLKDHKNDYEMVVLPNGHSFELLGEELLFYYIDPRPNDLADWGLNFFVDGDDKIFIYRSYDEIPKYLSVNIYSGEVTIYPNNLEAIPEVERSIFKELRSKVR